MPLTLEGKILIWKTQGGMSMSEVMITAEQREREVSDTCIHQRCEVSGRYHWPLPTLGKPDW